MLFRSRKGHLITLQSEGKKAPLALISGIGGFGFIFPRDNVGGGFGRHTLMRRGGWVLHGQLAADDADLARGGMTLAPLLLVAGQLPNAFFAGGPSGSTPG